jgi:hypothetical protein
MVRLQGHRAMMALPPTTARNANTALGLRYRDDDVSAKVKSDHDCSRWQPLGPPLASMTLPQLRHRPSDCPRGKDEDACSDEASDQIAEQTTTERDTEHVE